MSKVIGIDLRTSDACAAVWEGGEVRVIPRAEERAGASFSWAAQPGKTYTQMFRQFKAEAEGYLGQPVSGAAVAVPVSFNIPQRQALVRAGQAAGLEVRRLLSEPTAAGLARLAGGPAGQLLVCSMSGGALSVSAMELDCGVLEVRNCAGADCLGGSDWRQAAGETITRAQEGLDRNRAFEVVLAGDAVHISALRDLLIRQTGKEPVLAPGGCIAAGAAIQGGIISGELSDLLVLEVLTPDVLIEVQGEEAVSLFAPAPGCFKALPTVAVKTFPRSDQTEIRLLQDGQTVKHFFLRDIVPPDWREPQVPVTFDAGPDGLVEVSVRTPAPRRGGAPPGPAAPPPPRTPAELPDAVEVIRAILPVYDNLERAMRQDTPDRAYKRGVEMTMEQLKEVLGKLGVTEIDALGKPFDPRFHNAVMHIEDGSFGKNVVSQVFQTGFMAGDKVIRFAAVQVAN